MLDQLAAREAFRARLLTLVVATTGSTTLAATATGFSRASGSFLTEKFTAGMEVTGDGFSNENNASAIIEIPVALSLTLKGVTGRTPQASAPNRTLTVGLPAIRQWHGTQTPEAILKGTRPSVVEQWVPFVPEDDGAIIDTGAYRIIVNLPGNYGLAAPLRYMMALRDLFYVGWTFFVDGDMVRVTGNPAPSFTEPMTLENGYVSSTFELQWRVATTNLLVA